MKKVFDNGIIGKKFGKLTVLERVYVANSKRVFLNAICECGVIKSYRNDSLKTGNTKSCGCEKSEKTSERKKTHGMANSPLYKVWASMKKRCYNETEKCFRWYGGRGIKVCDDWKNSFCNFYEWACSNYKKGLRLDRINNDGNYEPTNCRWVTQKENCNNKSNNRFIEYKGETKTCAQWADSLNLGRSMICSRLKNGWSPEFVLTVKPDEYHAKTHEQILKIKSQAATKSMQLVK